MVSDLQYVSFTGTVPRKRVGLMNPQPRGTGPKMRHQFATPLLIKPSLLCTSSTTMSAFATPARRGGFYSSVLYADPGNANHHPRASVAELAALLRPEAPNLYKKGRKPGTFSPAKDLLWHFYSAQLIHYGVPVTKDKNGDKVRLLNAMNQFKLEVPSWVLKVGGK